MEYDPDAPYDEGDEDAENDFNNGFDRIVTEEELSEQDVFPSADEIGLAGSFAHLIRDEAFPEDSDIFELGPDIDEQNMRLAMSMCTPSGDPRLDGPDDKPFEAYVRACINTPGFFKRRSE